MSDNSKINSNLSEKFENNFSKTTENLIKNLKQFSSKNKHINLLKKYVKNKDIDKYVTLLYNLYKKINYSVEVQDCNTIQKNSNLCNTFELLSYLRENQSFNNYYDKTVNYKKNQISLHDIVDESDVEGCKVWMNIHGKILLRNIFGLKQMGKIPEDFLKDVDNIDKDLFSEFTPIDIFEYVSNNTLDKLELKVTMDYLTVNLKLVSKRKLKKREINNIINRICLIYLIKHGDSKEFADINLTIIFTDAKKTLPKSNYKVLGPREINSGLASFGDNKILIHRSEEHAKLLIHELIHLFKLDFSSVNIDFLPDILDINKSIQTIPNESITETLAVIINSIIVSFEIYKRKNTNIACFLLNYEISFNLFQCSKILNHFGYKTAYDFFRENDNNNRFQQTTSVISYFFIKTACLFNSAQLFNFLEDNFNDLNYNNLQDAKQNYTELVRESLENASFQNKIDEILEVFSKKNNLFYNTLRMTCIETD